MRAFSHVDGAIAGVKDARDFLLALRQAEQPLHALHLAPLSQHFYRANAGGGSAEMLVSGGASRAEVRLEDQLERGRHDRYRTIRLCDAMRDLVVTHRKHGLMLEGAGESEREPVELVVMFDGFPLLGVISCARISETNTQLLEALEHNHFAEDFNSALRQEGFVLSAEQEGSFVHATMLVTADKKGVEAHRGCTQCYQCCPWCTCADTLRLCLPWPARSPPFSWNEPHGGTEAKLLKVCKQPFPSTPLIFEAAHTPLPGEALPHRCRFCKQMPFAEREEYDAAHAS
eukprot:6195220-Pleurochrysis_carterae.AAC.3